MKERKQGSQLVNQTINQGRREASQLINQSINRSIVQIIKEGGNKEGSQPAR